MGCTVQDINNINELRMEKRPQIVVVQPRLDQCDHEANCASVRAIAQDIRAKNVRPDFLILPECFFRQPDIQAYEQFVGEIAAITQACVIGGSVHARIPPDEDDLYNAGYVITPERKILDAYTKRHPYGSEVGLGVMAGEGCSEFQWNGIRCAVVICADFWDSRLVHRLSAPPDLLCVVAASVSQEHGPAAARNLWQSLAVARAFELTSVVAMSDWAMALTEETKDEERGTRKNHDRQKMTCGVAGVANPTDLSGRFQPIANSAAWQAFTIDLEKLHAHRDSRRSRAFYFW